MKYTIKVQKRGINHACVGVVSDSRGKAMATTRLYPHGMEGAAAMAARDLADEKGLEIDEEEGDNG